MVLSGLSALKNLYLQQKSSFLVFKFTPHIGLHPWLRGKESACNARDTAGLISGSGRSPGKGNSHPLQNSCLEKSHGQRSLVDYSTWGHKRVRHDLATEHSRKHKGSWGGAYGIAGDPAPPEAAGAIKAWV